MCLCVIACQGFSDPFSAVLVLGLHCSVVWIFWGILMGRLQTVTPDRERERERERERRERERVSSIPLGHVATPKQNGKKNLPNSF